MAEESEDSDKQYEPSQKKLDDARRKGEIARSTDLTTSGAYAGFLIVLLTFGPGHLEGLADAMMQLLSEAVALSDAAFSGSGAAFHGGV